MKLANKNILVTVADGFIGSHLVERLLEENCNVRAFVFYNSFNSWGWLDTLDRKKIREIEIFPGDIRDANMVRNAMKNMDVVFHLAALISIPFSYTAPESFIDTNIKGALNVLHAAKDLGTGRVLMTSTSEVYGTAQFVPITEQHPRQGQSPYSASKIGADSLAESFFRSFALPVTIVRPFNTYGPRQSARAVIPAIILQLLNNIGKIKLGHLQPTRDLTYVKDTVEGFISIAKCNELIGQECNIASNTEITIGDLAKKIIELLNPDAEIVTDKKRIRPANSEVFRLLGSNKKIKDFTSWKPQYTLTKGLEETITWFKNNSNYDDYKSGIYNV